MNSQKPTVKKDEGHFSGDKTIIYNHPAFGMIRFGRTTGSKKLFGSEVENAGCISIEIQQGEEHWHLHQKYYRGTGKHIINLSMSYAQFSEAICNQNAEGVPCTFEYVQGQRIPSIEENTVSVSEQIKLDIKEQSEKINSAIKDLYAEISNIKISEKAKGELRVKADKIKMELTSNLPFIVAQCEEAVEHITTKAKIEVEAFAQSRIHELGMEALADRQGKLLTDGKK